MTFPATASPAAPAPPKKPSLLYGATTHGVRGQRPPGCPAEPSWFDHCAAVLGNARLGSTPVCWPSGITCAQPPAELCDVPRDHVGRSARHLGGPAVGIQHIGGRKLRTRPRPGADPGPMRPCAHAGA